MFESVLTFDPVGTAVTVAVTLIEPASAAATSVCVIVNSVIEVAPIRDGDDVPAARLAGTNATAEAEAGATDTARQR